MSTYNIPNFSSGIDGTMVAIATEVPMFPIMLLAFVWFFVFIGGVMRQSGRFGYADYPMWAVVASMSTFLLTLIMTITSGLVTLEVLGIVIGITIVSGTWFFLTKGKTEL